MKPRVCIAIIVMGVSGFIAEILLLRELLIVFSGNELSIGIIFSNWLILEALGCYGISRTAEKSKRKIETFSVLTILFCVSLPIAVFMARLLKTMLGVSIGEHLGFLPMWYSSFLILLPVSVLHGALFTFSCKIYALGFGKEKTSAGRVYVYETIGTIIGGIVSAYLLIPYLNAFQASFGIALLNMLVCGWLVRPFWQTGVYQKILMVVLGALVICFGVFVLGGQASNLHQLAIQSQWKNQSIVDYRNSPYGNICVIENQDQYIFFMDGIPTLITPIPDIPLVEEFVHLPLLIHADPKNILMLSGGAGGVISETLKHPSIESIEYAELDPLLFELLEKFSTPLTESELNDPRVTLRRRDGRWLLKTTPRQYDVIFVGVSGPTHLQANRFFTREFFALAKTKLNNEGILVFGLPGSLTYLSDELKNLNSCIFHTLSDMFAWVRIIPGESQNLFLASDDEHLFSVDSSLILNRLNQRNIATHVMVPWHIENKLHQGWLDWVARFLDESSQKINYDFQPLGLYYSIAHWNSLYAPEFGQVFRRFETISLWKIVLALTGFVCLYWISRRITRAIFGTGIPLSIVTTGFCGMICELMVIFIFQAIYGSVFSWIGLLMASFMTGAALGATVSTAVVAQRHDGLKIFIGSEVALIGLAIGLPIVFWFVHTSLDLPLVFGLGRYLFLLVACCCGLLVGFQFPLANQLLLNNNTSSSRTAALLYASDLLGGWIGGIVGAIVLLPILGLTDTCIVVASLKIVSLVVVSTQMTNR